MVPTFSHHFPYSLVRRKFKPESAIPQLSWLCMSSIPGTITSSWTSFPYTLYSVAEYLVLIDAGCLNALLLADSIPSTSDHWFWDWNLESFWVPWDLQSSVVGSLAIDIFGNTSVSPNRWILSSVRSQHIYSHLLDYTLYLDSNFHYQWVILCLLTVYIHGW